MQPPVERLLRHERLVVRHLHLPQQGYPESYGEAPAVMPPMPLFDAGGGLPMQFAGHAVAMPPQRLDPASTMLAWMAVSMQ